MYITGRQGQGLHSEDLPWDSRHEGEGRERHCSPHTPRPVPTLAPPFPYLSLSPSLGGCHLSCQPLSVQCDPQHPACATTTDTWSHAHETLGQATPNSRLPQIWETCPHRCSVEGQPEVVWPLQSLSLWVSDLCEAGGSTMPGADAGVCICQLHPGCVGSSCSLHPLYMVPHISRPPLLRSSWNM